MDLLRVTVAFMMIRLCVGTVEFTRKNISCSDIKTTQGFQFSHECPTGAHLLAYYNKTTIATIIDGKPAFMRDLVKSVDNSSITTIYCRDLRVKCQIFNVEHAKEKRVIWTVSALPKEIKEPDASTPYGLWIGVGSVVLIILGILVGFCCCYRSWRNNMMKQHRTATVLIFLETAFCRKRKSNETTDPRYVAAANDPQGSCENGLVQNGATVVHSGDTNGHDSRAIKRVKKEDPGGFNCVKVTHACSGCVRGDCGAEDHETESSLLPNERANIRDPDMAGGAEAFVNNSGFDPGQVSRCAAPNSDVESPQDEETHT